MKKVQLLLITVLLLVACGAETGTPSPEQFKGTWLPTPVPVSDFTLTGPDNVPVQLSDFSDKLVLIYFGYTFCPDVCPTTMADLGRVQRAVDDAGDQVQVIMVSVDPERDTPEQLAEYVAHFHPTFVGLTGDKAEIDAAAGEFGVFYERHEGTAASGYLVDHTARVFVVDRDGKYALSFAYGTAVDDIVSDLRLLLNSEA